MEKQIRELEKNMENYFFWKSSIHPFNEDEGTWTPYNLDESNYLEECYQKYLNKQIIQPEIGDYQINFELKIQSYKYDDWRQRPIIRGTRDKILNIQRRQRLEFSPNLINSLTDKNLKIEEKLISENNSLEFYKEEYVSRYFSIIEQNEFKIEILKKYDLIKDFSNIDYESYLENLRLEIEKLSKIEVRENYYEMHYLSKITKENFYHTILLMFSVQGFLYKCVKHILRQNEVKTELDKIKYYYYGLIASIKKLSFTYNELLKVTSYNNNGKIYAYGVIELSDSDINCMKSNCSPIVLNEFVSVSLSKNSVLNILKNEDILFELEININLQNEYIYMTDRITEFPKEEEILIKSGSVIILYDIREEYCEHLKKNIKIIRGSLLSLEVLGYLIYLKYNNNIKNINLCSNKLSEKIEIVKALSETFILNNKLKKIDLSHNNLGDNTEAIVLISDALKQNKTINFVNLSSNNLGGSLEGIKLFIEALKINTSIQYLNLDNNNLNEKSVKLLSEALKVNYSITRIDLNKNNIGKNTECLRYLGEAIKENKTLSRIDLYKNHIGPNTEGFKELSEALKLNKTINRINLWENNLGDNIQAMIYLSDVLKVSNSLTYLDLPKNLLGTNMEAFNFLCEAIKTNNSLNVLNLYENEIGSNIECLKLLSDALIENNSIKIVNLCENKIKSNSAFEKILKELIHLKKNITINY